MNSDDSGIASMRTGKVSRVGRVQGRAVRLGCDVLYAADSGEVVGFESGVIAFARVDGNIERSAGKAAARETQAMVSSEGPCLSRCGGVAEHARAHVRGAIRVCGTLAPTGCESAQGFCRGVACGRTARAAMGSHGFISGCFSVDTGERRDTDRFLQMTGSTNGFGAAWNWVEGIKEFVQ